MAKRKMALFYSNKDIVGHILLNNAVAGSKDPLRHDQGAAARVTFNVDERLPGPLSKFGIITTDNQRSYVVNNSSAFGCGK